ncbi:MAG: aldehyde dehydrogenase family protein [bacterium]|nr:aldehyde dehydrogenase family protein [bacterium]
MTIRIPTLRAGEPYYSLELQTLTDVRDGSPVAEVSQTLPGMIARDLDRIEEHRRSLDAFTVTELVEICRRAARLFMEAELPLGDSTQTPDDYVRQLAATAGMPEVMGRANMAKIEGVMSGIDGVLDGLTRGLDLSVLDGGWGSQDGRRLSYLRQTEALGAILPNNSPGVHNLWIPAIPLKVALVLKPGSAEPWTPYRIAQAMIQAGCPKEAFSLYPTDYSGAAEVLLRTGRSMFFGDAATVESWKGTGKVEIHGPGWSKVILGADAARDFEHHLDLLVGSVAANGGRSCINASGVWAAGNGREIAEAMAERLARVQARPLDHPEAQLAAFPDPEIARRISEMIDQQLETPGAEDVTARYRDGNRVAEAGGCTFLLPTVVYCEDPSHPLAASEFIFPFAAVVETPADELLSSIGPTLIGSVISGDETFRREALESLSIDRLNLGPIPTYQISWDQPHEGNLFEHLYHQRAFQAA